MAVWCFGAIAFHLIDFSGTWLIEGGTRQSVAVEVFVSGLSAFGVFAAVCVLLAKPYALKLVFLNFLQWGAVLVLVFPVAFLTISPGATLDWKPIAGFVVFLGVPWIVWFRYFKVSKRVLATFGRNM
ncbi:hypothetical protein P8935_12205 [Telmatobacter sp. DSM 110680]|uniref:DUF2569 domain-containing protein n=1 Tax=Telmatobacter sp. DSM 110680 TaxID=3036704 RepID=A0AAU7DTI3_9BACT